MKKHTLKWQIPVFLCLGVVILSILACWWFQREKLPDWESPEGLSGAQARALEREILKIVKDYPPLPGANLDRADIDSVEDRLIQLGYCVEDSDAVYPSYLANSEELKEFWEDFSAGKNARTSFLRISEDGGFGLTCFYHEKGVTHCILTGIGWEAGAPCVRIQENLPVYDMTLSDWGTFYYRLYPEDPHYIDYMQVRLQPTDRENYDLCRKYVLPVGYQMVNLFLVDWSEENWGDLSFPDVFEYLYTQKTGGDSFRWTDYADPEDRTRARIPSDLFEEVLLSYFRISREKLRQEADCQDSGYPWRTFFGDDLTTRSYPLCEPVVTSAEENEDGTVTLFVRVGSPEKKTDNLFSHEITIRPLADGGYQYVSNKVTEVGQWGLPFRQPRFQLDY